MVSACFFLVCISGLTWLFPKIFWQLSLKLWTLKTTSTIPSLRVPSLAIKMSLKKIFLYTETRENVSFFIDVEFLNNPAIALHWNISIQFLFYIYPSRYFFSILDYYDYFLIGFSIWFYYISSSRFPCSIYNDLSKVQILLFQPPITPREKSKLLNFAARPTAW